MSPFATGSIAASALFLLLNHAAVFAAPKDQQHNMHGQMDHSSMDHSQMNMAKPAKTMKTMKTMKNIQETTPKEPGQGAFATIAEIVALLTSDPKTDWSKVDIAGLREHLIDMD